MRSNSKLDLIMNSDTKAKELAAATSKDPSLRINQ